MYGKLHRRLSAALITAALVLMAALAAIAPSPAAAYPCSPSMCPPPPGGPAPPPSPTYTKVIATGHGQRDFKAEHQSTDAQLIVVYRRSDNQPVSAYVSTQTHAWDQNWFDGFVGVDQEHVLQDGYDAMSTPQHRVTVCGNWDPGACSDQWPSTSDSVPLQNILSGLSTGATFTLRVDVSAED